MKVIITDKQFDTYIQECDWGKGIHALVELKSKIFSDLDEPELSENTEKVVTEVDVPPHYKPFSEWSRNGYRIIKGSKATWFNDVAHFSNRQVATCNPPAHFRKSPQQPKKTPEEKKTTSTYFNEAVG